MIDGTERLGVIRFDFETTDPEPDLDLLRALSALTAELVMSKRSYGDFFEITRRRKSVSVTAELLWQLLPPLTFATEELVIAGFFVPTNDIGGDAFDYGVDRERARLADVRCHGPRVERRPHGHDRGRGLPQQPPRTHGPRHRRPPRGSHPGRPVRRVQLRHRRARLPRPPVGAPLVAERGHPPPLVLRRGHEPELQAVGGQPFGVGPASAALQTQLEPGDRLILYTDGITEARGHDGVPLGVERLTELVTAHAEVALAPEAVRRRHAHGRGVEPATDPRRRHAGDARVAWRRRSPAHALTGQAPAGRSRCSHSRS